MFTKTVTMYIILNGESVKISISICCTPETPNTELIRRAGNIFRAAANDATYEVK